MVLFPVLAATGFVLLGGSRRRGEPRSAELSNASAPHEDRPRPGRTATLAALVLVVLPGALSLGVAAEADGRSFTTRFLVTALVSAAVLVLIAALADRRGTILFDDAAWALAALVAPTSILWLSVLSSLTGVRVTITGTFRDVNWFPYWLGIPATALAIGVVVWLLRHRSRGTWVSIGRWSLTCLTVPALLWVLVGALSPALGPIDVFHEGEGLVGARLLLDGQVPWRDFLSTHGLLADSLVALPGLALIEDSRWGAASGELIWVTPVYWIFWFAFMAYLLRRNNWLLGLWCALTIVGSSLTSTPWISPLFVVTSETYLRTLLYPLILLAVAWVVRNPVSRRIALLSALVVLQVVLTPETALPGTRCLHHVGCVRPDAFIRSAGAAAISDRPPHCLLESGRLRGARHRPRSERLPRWLRRLLRRVRSWPRADRWSSVQMGWVGVRRRRRGCAPRALVLHLVRAWSTHRVDARSRSTNSSSCRHFCSLCFTTRSS